MAPNDDDNGDLPDLSNRELLRVLMQEIVDVRNELRQGFSDGMANIKAELKADIANVDGKLSKKIDALSSDFHTLRLEVHQNQITFMSNHTALEGRVTVLEKEVLKV